MSESVLLVISAFVGIIILVIIVYLFGDRIGRIGFRLIPGNGIDIGVETRENPSKFEVNIGPILMENPTDPLPPTPRSHSPFLTEEIGSSSSELEPEFMSDDYIVGLMSAIKKEYEEGDEFRLEDRTNKSDRGKGHEG